MSEFRENQKFLHDMRQLWQSYLGRLSIGEITHATFWMLAANCRANGVSKETFIAFAGEMFDKADVERLTDQEPS